MPVEAYYLEPGGPKRLEVSWDGWFNQFAVRLDGQPVGAVSTRKALRKGCKFDLPDGSTLIAHLGTSIMPELHLLRDGRPLPEFAYFTRVRVAGISGFLIGGFGTLIGLMPFVMPQGASGEPFSPFALGSLIAGGVFLILSFFILRRSVMAVILATVLSVLLDIGVVVVIVSGEDFNPGAVFFVGITIALFQAIPAALSLKRGRPVRFIIQ